MTKSQGPPDRKKERVLHTRVSAEFEDELKRRASALGTSVSNLVRHTLSHTFGGRVMAMADGGGAAHGGMRVGWVSPVQSAPAEDASAEILGWQELVLNRNAVCDRCNDILPKGAKAAVAIYDGSGPVVFLCPGCVKKVGDE